MNRRSLPSTALLLLCACDSGLGLELEGKQCDGNGSCVSGYVCDVGRNLCVHPDQLLHADLDATLLEQGGAAGELGWGGTAGSAADASTSQAGAGGAGSVPGNGGSATVREAGADSGVDSGTGSQADADAGCTPTLLYPDQDGDGVGVTAGGTLRCPAPGWVSLSGDCRDDVPDAFLGQAAYFGEAFDDPDKPAQVSFDFDCDGSETPDPNNTSLDPAPECTALACSGSGYLPAVPARSGSGSEPRCGSNQLRRCVGGLAPLALCSKETLTVADRFRCK